jgi:hypothetical protein
MLIRMKVHRLLRLLAALVMLAAVVRPFGNLTVCGLSEHPATAEQHHQGAPAAAVTMDHDGSCHEQMGCGLATLGIKLDTEPAIPTVPAHGESIAAGVSSPASTILLPLTPPPRA